MKRIKVEKGKTLKDNYTTKSMLECMKFHNREGEDIYSRNCSDELGTKETNVLAKKMGFEYFTLEGLLMDCKAFAKGYNRDNDDDTYCVGRTHSHVWVHCNDERIFMFHY